MNLEGMSISEYRILLGKTHPDLEKILKDTSVVGTVQLLNKEGYYDQVFTEVSFYEVKGIDSRANEFWSLGFFRSEKKAEERIVEETKLDKKLKLRHRRYLVVTHVFRD
jgi:hypothetical protein